LVIFRKLFCLVLLFVAASVQAKPFPVSTEVSIHTGDWYPLPKEDMKAAAVDTALAELTKGGLFSIVAKDGSNKLHLGISLIGPAETAKLTIQVHLKDRPSYVSTASISVHDMDYQGIYNAFEHIGRVAAQRLNDKTEALVIKPRDDIKAEGSKKKPSPNDKTLQALYDKAQSLKRQYRYNKSRVSFEQVAAATGKGSERLSTLAKDELKYGLTVFEAKQSMVAMGGGGAPGAMFKSIRNAENLYRQILAENSDNLMRTQEAQSALDNLSVTHNALKNVLRVQTLMAASNVRMMMEQEVMMTGVCPDRKQTSEFAVNMRTDVSIKSVRKKGDEILYDFTENRTGNSFSLSCANYRVTVVN